MYNSNNIDYQTANLFIKHRFYKEAIQVIDSNLRLDPNDIDFLKLKINALYYSDQYDECLKTINYSLVEYRNNCFFWLTKFDALVELKQYNEACNTIKHIYDNKICHSNLNRQSNVLSRYLCILGILREENMDIDIELERSLFTEYYNIFL
jgi:tetratricopeptide (TPR) repeat protein